MKIFTKIKENMYLQLFFTFFKLGLFTFGGGMAMIPLMQGIIVDKKGWMTEDEVVDCIAVSQSLPGVIAINMATYIGTNKKGFWGALISTIGVIIPSFVIMILIVEVLTGIRDNTYVAGALVGIKASAVGMIVFSAYKVGKQVLSKNAMTWILAIVSFVGVSFLGVNAVWAVLLGIVVGITYTAIVNRKKGDGVK